MTVFKTLDGDYLVSENDILTKREICEVIGISIATIHRWQRKGLPYTQFSNYRNGYNLLEVQHWMDEQGMVPIDLMKTWKERRESK